VAYDLPALEEQIGSGAKMLDRVENFQLKNIFNYGRCLLLARDGFQDAKFKGTLLSGVIALLTGWQNDVV